MVECESRTQGARIAALFARLRTQDRADQRGRAARASFRNEFLTGRRYRPPVPVRFLAATAGLLVLAGSAVAGRPTAHTLRKSPGGPIAAIAENNSVAAWFKAG